MDKILGLLPDNLHSQILIDAYLSRADEQKKIPRRFRSPYNEHLHAPGTVTMLTKYLSGPGKDKIPDIVGKQLGDHWYTGAAKLLSKTAPGRALVLNRFVDKALPKIDGSNELAKQFMEAGGNV